MSSGQSIGRALREIWIGDQRPWNFDVTASDLQSLKERYGDLTLADQFVLSVIQPRENRNYRARGIARSHVPGVSSRYVAVMLKKMSKSAANRYMSADDEKRARSRKQLDGVRETTGLSTTSH